MERFADWDPAHTGTAGDLFLPNAFSRLEFAGQNLVPKLIS
jgi:hypothetical protein